MSNEQATREHRKIVLRTESSVLDTGLTTASDSELSSDNRLKKRIHAAFEQDELPRKKPKPNEVEEKAAYETVNDITPVSLTENEQIEKEIEQFVMGEPVIDLLKVYTASPKSVDSEDVIQPGQERDKETQTAFIEETQNGPLKHYDLFEDSEDSEDSASQIEEVKHTVPQKKIEQGKRLADYIKKYRASGGIVKKRQTKSQRSGLIFPVARILKNLKQKIPKMKIATTAAITLAGVLEYLIADLIDISGTVTIELGRKRITPRHIFLAVQNDEAFKTLFQNVHITSGGVLPKIQPAGEILKAKKSSVNTESSSESSSGEGGLEKPTPTKQKAGYARAEAMKKQLDSVEKTSGVSAAKIRPVRNYRIGISKKKMPARVQQGKRLAEYMKQRRALDKANVSSAQSSQTNEDQIIQQSDKENITAAETSGTKLERIYQVKDRSSSDDDSFKASSDDTTSESDLSTTIDSEGSQSSRSSVKSLDERLKDFENYSTNSKGSSQHAKTRSALQSIENTRKED